MRFDVWEKLTGETCTEFSDFMEATDAEEVKKNLGKMYVTQKATAQQDWRSAASEARRYRRGSSGSQIFLCRFHADSV